MRIWLHHPACICSQCDPEGFYRVFKSHPDQHKQDCICSDCCDARYEAGRDPDAARREYVHALPETMGDMPGAVTPCDSRGRPKGFDIATSIRLVLPPGEYADHCRAKVQIGLTQARHALASALEAIHKAETHLAMLKD